MPILRDMKGLSPTEAAAGRAAGEGGSATCPACGARVPVEARLLVGELFRCASCRSHLEVANIDPPVLEPYHRIDEEEEDPGR